MSIMVIYYIVLIIWRNIILILKGSLTEIIKDNNLKSKFNNIINLQTKIAFKRIKKNEQITRPKEKLMRMKLQEIIIIL